MIELKRKIDASLRYEVECEFNKRIENLEDDHFENVKLKIMRRLELIKNAHEPQLRELYLHTKVLYSLLLMENAVLIENMKDYHKKIAAYLSHFADPLGVIPDHSMGDGYLDDCVMVNLCIKKLPKKARDKIDKLLSVAK